MDINSTQEYFGLSLDELLEAGDKEGYTKEECKLFDEGSEVVFFDDEKELQNEDVDFNNYLKSKNLAIKVKLETINKRIAVVLT